MPVFFGTELCFGSLCNLGLLKKLRFSLQRHKTAESGLYLDSGKEYRIYAQSFVYAQSFAFAVFATLICQINSVFPCKDTKAAKSVAFCDSLPVFLWHRALFMHRALFWHRALRIGTVNLHNMPELYSWKINKRIKYWRKFFL